MIKVNVEVDRKPWRNKLKNPKKYIFKKLKKINRVIPTLKGKNFTFTILLTNYLRMKKLNKKFRNHNKSTDVLSFPSFQLKKLRLKEQKNIYIGDIAICYEIINKRSNNSNFFLEFDKMWIHGYLHLLGHDHKKKKDFLKMKKIEDLILNKFYKKN